MKNLVFAENIKAVLEDGTEVTGVTGYVIDDKRVYKLSDKTVLTGTKKIKNIKFARFIVLPDILPYIMAKVNE